MNIRLLDSLPWPKSKLRCNIDTKLEPLGESAVVAVYNTHARTERGVSELRRAGVDLRTLSVIGKHTLTDEYAVGCYSDGTSLKNCGRTDVGWGLFWRLLVGSAFFAIPEIGPVLVAGPLAGRIVAALESAAVLGGLSAIGASLVAMGIPRNCVSEYETALKTDKYLLLVNGSTIEVGKARGILESTLLAEVGIGVAR